MLRRVRTVWVLLVVVALLLAGCGAAQRAVEKALGARGHVLAASDRARLDQAVADLKAAMKSEDGDAIDAAMRAANEAAQALTADQMNDVLRQTATGRKISEF